MDLGGWLRGLGLGQYEAAFRDNEIDDTTLPNLTAEDLKDLGVGIVGHRRKLLDAIATLRADGDAKATPPRAAAATNTPSENIAERRHVTVMFSDLVGSTAMSGRMDAEDLREIISAYQKCVTETVRRFGGFVAKYMGDGVLIYFGYPQAHEDDAEQAVRAGLELIAAVSALRPISHWADSPAHSRASGNSEAAHSESGETTGSPLARGRAGQGLQTRVGIATGLVVVGDLVGSGEAQERGIVGETPNLAARLQGVAEPNMVVIAESTRRLVGNLFEFEDLGPKELKGFSGSVRAFAPLRASAFASRFEALRAGALTALVGREQESELLLRCWSNAKDGKGEVVLISGEAGIGKSRLTAALLGRLGRQSYTRLRYFCSPQHTDSAFYAIVGQMERAAGLERGDTPCAKLDKLDALLAQAPTSAQNAALLAEMLSLPNDGRYPALDLAPQQRRQKTLEALGSQLEALARARPVLMVLEDAHWADPTSLEAFGRVVDRIAGLRALLIVTFRPEFAAPWVGRPRVTALAINRLGQGEIAAMIDRVAGDRPLPADIRRDIIERTDGIPLFVEEMTKVVLEAERESGAPRTMAAGSSPALAVPASLHASLMARLDRLGPAKEVAQICAAIGREFSHALLAAVVRKPEAELDLALVRLVQAGLLLPQGSPPFGSYLFNHALVQDAAYGTLLREPRRALHARIAEALESHFAETAENQPELLARHYTEAGLIEKAADFWGKAGQRSLARSALVEAVAQLTRALDQIATLPGTPALRRDQIKLQVALINPLMHVKGYAAPETKTAIDRARALIEQAGSRGEGAEDPELLFSVLYGSWMANYITFNGDVVRELAVQFLDLAEKQDAAAPRMIGHRIMGSGLAFIGDIAQSRVHLDRAMALYDPAKHRQLAARYGQDSRVSIFFNRSYALWMLGYPEAALADNEQALTEAREIGQAATLMYALDFAWWPPVQCGDYAISAARFDELLALADEKGALFWRGAGMAGRGCIMALTGAPADAVSLINSGLATLQTTGTTLWKPLYLPHLARAHAALNQFDEAWRCIGDALTAAEATKEKWCEAEIHRTAGDIALMPRQPDAAKAEAYFARALAVARSQQAKSWELRAAMSMARLLRDRGKRGEARELLAQVYNWFTEGFDTLDLKEAKALLGALAS
jgi:class 3 adenylate cyclase/predicted ATPase